MRILFFAGLIILLFSCNNQDRKVSQQVHTDTATRLLSNGLEIEPGIGMADSMEILYYEHTDDDSLRYSRFYTFTATGDSTELKLLKTQLATTYSLLPQVKDCRSQGKIHLFTKGEPVKTVYFSQAGEPCNYLYFIRNGNFFYFPLSETFSKFLEENKEYSRQP